MLTVGCGKKSDTKASMNYEQPILTMVGAVKVWDTESYLNCYTEGAREKYEESESYNSQLAKTLVPSQEKGLSALSYSKNSAKELDSEQIGTLEDKYKEEYHKRINISKAYEISADLTVIQSMKTKRDSVTLTVIYSGGSWKLYGDVIEEFVFE